MNTRSAKPVTMTGVDGVGIVCDAVDRPITPRRSPRARRKFEEPAALAQSLSSLYRVAELRFVDVPFEALTEADARASRTRIDASPRMADVLRGLYGARTVELFGAVALNNRNQVTGHCIVGQGNAANCPVSMPELGRFLFLTGAVGFIVFHNHPSGELAWSSEDMELTKRIGRASKILGVQLLDHLLLTSNGHLSMLDAGLSSILRPDDAP